jgi:flagellar protein FliO/FliZ
MGKLLIVLMVLGSIIAYTSPIVVKADKHVMDCINQEEDCLGEVGQPEKVTPKNKNEINGMGQGSLFLNIVKMVIALLFVLALIYCLLLFIKKRNRLFHHVGMLENVGGISVGQQKSIQIIRIGEKIYLVGVGDNVTLLEELTDETVKNKLLEKQEAAFKTQAFLPQILSRTKMENEKPSSFTLKLQRELANYKKERQDLINQQQNGRGDKHV